MNIFKNAAALLMIAAMQSAAMSAMMTFPDEPIPGKRTRFKKTSKGWGRGGKVSRKSPHTKARCKWIDGAPRLWRP